MATTSLKLIWTRSNADRLIWQLLRRAGLIVLHARLTLDQTEVEAQVPGSSGRVDEIRNLLRDSGVRLA